MPANPFADLPTTADDEGFAQPVHGLFADLDAGLGCINLPDDFALAPSANQLSVIADWQSFAGYAPPPRPRGPVSRALGRHRRRPVTGTHGALPGHLRHARVRVPGRHGLAAAAALSHLGGGSEALMPPVASAPAASDDAAGANRSMSGCSVSIMKP